MVTNNLLIRLKQRDKNNIIKAKTVLQKLKGNIPVLLDSNVKTDIRASKSGYDIMLINTFASPEDMQIYLDHPVHIEVSAYIIASMEASASFCYESDSDN